MKVIFDECVNNRRLRRLVRESGEYEFLLWDDLGYEPTDGDKDTFLVKEAAKREHFVVTIDFRTITPKKFPPCQGHGGILQLGENGLSDEYMFARLEAFRTLLLEHRAVGHYTYLEDDGIRIITHNEPIERVFSEYDTLKNIPRN